MQNLGARLKYTEQYCMSNIIAASCHLGPSTAVHTSLASQRVKGYYKNAHSMTAKHAYQGRRQNSGSYACALHMQMFKPCPLIYQ